MGSLRPRNSIQAGKARSVKSLTKAGRKPTQPKPSTLRSDAKRPHISPTQVVREMRDGVPATELKDIHRKLEIAGAVAYICAATLREQAADYDSDIALCLQRCVGDEIDRQMEEIDRLLGRERTYEGVGGDGGAS